MANIGCLGEIPFTVSDKVVQTIDNAVWSGAARYAVHSRHGTYALTEFTGVDPDNFGFDMKLSAHLGVDPMKAILLLWQYERNAQAIPLVLGDKVYGKYRWVVTKHKAKLNRYARDGNLLGATVSVELLEYLKE